MNILNIVKNHPTLEQKVTGPCCDGKKHKEFVFIVKTVSTEETPLFTTNTSVKSLRAH